MSNVFFMGLVYWRGMVNVFLEMMSLKAAAHAGADGMGEKMAISAV